MVNYNQFCISNDVAYNVYKALSYCFENGEDGIIFDKNTYHVYSKMASQGVFSMSNHSDPGFKRSLFLLENFENFTIDGGGSEFIFKDVMTPVILSGCKNITLKNICFSSEKMWGAVYRVIRSKGNEADIEALFGESYIHAGDMYAGSYEGENYKIKFMLSLDEGGKIIPGTVADYFIAFNDDDKRTVFLQNDDGTIKATNLPCELKKGQILNFTSGKRCAANIFINSCINTSIENVTIHSGTGMGVIAQNCDNVDIDKLNIYPKEGTYRSVAADGTHFVHCKGKINIKNSIFERQGDDALNIHSIYFRVADKKDRLLLLELANFEQKGVDILNEGDTLEFSKPDTLLPYDTFKVINVKMVNNDIIEVMLDKSTDDVSIGDVADEISYVPDITFENCRVLDNRARGMLLASRGKTVIKNNYFHTSGAAIKFESDGKFWFESGGTKDVLICGNVFDACKFSASPQTVIYVSPREKTEEGRYFHKKIAICNNEFKGCHGDLVYMDNTEEFIFTENKISEHKYGIYTVNHCKNIKTDV